MFLPLAMEKRHSALLSFAGNVLPRHSPDELFDQKVTIHADLEILWLKPNFYERIAPANEFQIVLAKVNPGQKSRAHLHEKGSSSFILLNRKEGFAQVDKLIYRWGRLLRSGAGKIEGAQVCPKRVLIDIHPYEVHEFENQSKKPAHLLIVTHPIIYVGKDREDIFLVNGFE